MAKKNNKDGFIPGSSPEPQIEKFICLKCLNSFVKEMFWFSSGLCRPCNSMAAQNYGLDLDDVGAAVTAFHNLPWYKKQLPPKEEGQDVQYIRILLLASGVAIKESSDIERRGAEKMKEVFPWLGSGVNRIGIMMEEKIQETEFA